MWIRVEDALINLNNVYSIVEFDRAIKFTFKSGNTYYTGKFPYTETAELIAEDFLTAKQNGTPAVVDDIWIKLCDGSSILADYIDYFYSIDELIFAAHNGRQDLLDFITVTEPLNYLNELEIKLNGGD